MKIEQVKIPMDIIPPSRVKLVKSNGETHYGTQFKFVEWNGDEIGSRAKQMHDEPQIGYSVIIDPQYLSFTWLTTPITEIISDTSDNGSRSIHFKTKNSEYKLLVEEDDMALWDNTLLDGLEDL
jgi:hypothetical protein